MRVHAGDHRRRRRTRRGEADEEVAPARGVAERATDVAAVGDRRHFLLDPVHPGRAPRVDGTGRIAEDHVAHPHADQELAHRNGTRTGAIDDDRDVAQGASGDLARVHHAGQHHHRRPMLVVVEDRNTGLPLQPLFDVEATRRGDVLQVDASERRLESLHDRDDLIRILRGQADRKRLHTSKRVEQHRLPFHDRHRGPRTDVAESEHGGTVRHNRHQVALDGVVVHPLGMLGDPLRRLDRARRQVEQAQDVLVSDRHLALDLEHALIAPVEVDRLGGVRGGRIDRGQRHGEAALVDEAPGALGDPIRVDRHLRRPGRDRRRRDRMGDCRGRPEVEHLRDDVVRCQRVRGHHAGERNRGREQHLVIHLARPHIEQAAEEPRKHRRDVHLVGIL